MDVLPFVFGAVTMALGVMIGSAITANTNDRKEKNDGNQNS